MKQITIYEFLERNRDILDCEYMAYDPAFGWSCYWKKPKILNDYGFKGGMCIGDFYNIKKYNGDFKTSIIKIHENKELLDD